MENINNLISAVISEAKRQEEERKEYISIVHQLIEGTEKIRTNLSGEQSTWRICFRLSDGYFERKIYFSSEISKYGEDGWSLYAVENLERANREIDECINRLYDKGAEYVDNFINYLSKVAIPQFLLDRHPNSYYVA